MNATLRREGLPLRYTLVAVSDLARGAKCVEAIAPFRMGALIPRTGDEALAALGRFGAPRLLITDLSLPPRDGFVLVEAVRALLPKRLPVIGLSEFESLRAYAARRADLRFDAVIPGSASAAELTDVIGRILGGSRDEGSWNVGVDIDTLMRNAADETVRITGARGATVYIRVADNERFRAHVSWVSEEAVGSPFASPELFEWVRKSGDAILLPDLATPGPAAGWQAAGASPVFQQVVRGVVAAPVKDAQDAVIGVLCGFDVRPLSIGTLELDALRTLAFQVGQALGGAPA
jgi:CheY-like chemotaxis protein